MNLHLHYIHFMDPSYTQPTWFRIWNTSLLQSMVAQQLCHVETYTKITRHKTTLEYKTHTKIMHDKTAYKSNIQYNVMWCNIMQCNI